MDGQNAVMVPLKELDRELIKTRVSLNEEAIADYTEKVMRGVNLPPARVFEIDGRKVLVGGNHRLRAFERAKRDSMPCVVEKGDRWKALVAAIEDNKAHGVRRSPLDKRLSIELVLKQRPELSNGAVGEICDVDPKTVQSERNRLESSREIPSCEKRTGHDGRTRAVPQRPAAPQQAERSPPPPQHRVAQEHDDVLEPVQVKAGGETEVSGAERRKAPPRKPASDYLNDAIKALAHFGNLCATANEAQACEHYKTIQRAISNLGPVMTAWKKQIA